MKPGKLNYVFDFKFIKFIYSEKATKFCKISIVNLTVTTQDKSKVESGAFSEYMNFIKVKGRLISECPF